MASARNRLYGQSVAGGFCFVTHIRALCADMVARLPELAHIDLSQVIFATVQARKPTPHGVYAALHALRFEGGSRYKEHHGRTWMIPRVVGENGQEILYVIRFYLPRYLNLPLREKLAVALHELWHISPQFNGDVRRFPGRCHLHTAISSRYEQQVQRMLNRWLASQPPEHLYEFLRYDFRRLQQRYGTVLGQRVRIPTPRLLCRQQNPS